MTADLHMKLSPADLAWLQTKQVLNASVGFNNGTNSLTIGFNAKNYFKSIARSLPLNQHFRRNVTLQNFWDPAATSGDISLTTT